MSSLNDKINDLNLKLKSATRLNLKNRKVENSLRSLERSLTENISLIQSESDLILQQMKDVTSRINKAKHQISIVEVCNVMHKSNIESHLSVINAHKQEFDDMFAREKEKEAEKEETERQKLAKMLEMNEQKAREAVVVERECDAIEQECSVLTKRNKAILLKLKRQLIKAEDRRHELMNKIGFVDN